MDRVSLPATAFAVVLVVVTLHSSHNSTLCVADSHCTKQQAVCGAEELYTKQGCMLFTGQMESFRRAALQPRTWHQRWTCQRLQS